MSNSIPMILHCPECRARHVDAGEFATKEHHTHACQRCGFVWRPAVVATRGVQFLPGFRDDEHDKAADAPKKRLITFGLKTGFAFLEFIPLDEQSKSFFELNAGKLDEMKRKLLKLDFGEHVSPHAPHAGILHLGDEVERALLAKFGRDGYDFSAMWIVR